MTDLCYNCGSCHLPQPCGVPMAECLICHSHGHTWNFCHRGCHRHQPGYLYYAICHNCDAWHLPAPCQKVEVHCNVCNQHGHLPFYCPISPVPHNKQVPDASPTVGVVGQADMKRKRVENNPSDPASYRVVLPDNTIIPFNAHQLLLSPLMADEAYTLKMDAVGAAMGLAPYHRPHEVFAILAKKFLGPVDPSVSSALRTQAQISTGPETRLLMPTHQTPGQFHDGINAPTPTPRVQTPQQQYQRAHLQSAYSTIPTGNGDAIAPEERLDALQEYQDRRMKHPALQQQMQNLHNDHQTFRDPTRCSRTVSSQTMTPDMGNQLGLVTDQNIQYDGMYGGIHGSRGEGEYGPGVDVGCQQNVRLDISTEGRASVVSTGGMATTIPSIERDAYASTHTSDAIHLPLPYSNTTVHSISSTFGGLVDDTPHTKALEGSPKVPVKRARKAPANPRPRAKTAAAKAKEAKEAKEAVLAEQAQQQADQKGQQQAGQKVQQAQQQATIQQQQDEQQDEPQDQQQTQEHVQQSQHFQQPLPGSESA